MSQTALFHDSLNDALREVVNALGGPKKVGPRMKPEKTVEAASTWVRDCLNDNRDERFDPEQLIWLADRRGYSLTPLESEMERRERIQRERAEKLEAENALLKGLLVGKAV
jgi:hypothetical protein